MWECRNWANIQMNTQTLNRRGQNAQVYIMLTTYRNWSIEFEDIFRWFHFPIMVLVIVLIYIEYMTKIISIPISFVHRYYNLYTYTPKANLDIIIAGLIQNYLPWFDFSLGMILKGKTSSQARYKSIWSSIKFNFLRFLQAEFWLLKSYKYYNLCPVNYLRFGHTFERILSKI